MIAGGRNVARPWHGLNGIAWQAPLIARVARIARATRSGVERRAKGDTTNRFRKSACRARASPCERSRPREQRPGLPSDGSNGTSDVERGRTQINDDATHMTPLLFVAAISSALGGDRALQLLARDRVNIPEQITACARQDPQALGEALQVRQISADPKLLLVTVFYDGCVCFAQNCPYWVFRIKGNAATKVLESVGIDVKVTPADGRVPDIDEVAHDSAMLKSEALYVYRNGTYVASAAWRLRGRINGGEDRKPVSVAVRFTPGGSSTRLSGTIGFEWGDVYTFHALAGQTLKISSMQAEQATLVGLQGGGHKEVLMTRRPVRLPATGTYTITVDPSMDAGYDSSYSFTLSIY